MRLVLSTVFWALVAFVVGIVLAVVVALLRSAAFTDQIGIVLWVVGGVLLAVGLMSLTRGTAAQRTRWRLEREARVPTHGRRIDLSVRVEPLAVTVGVLLGSAAVLAVAYVVSDVVEKRQAADRVLPYKIMIEKPAADAAERAGIDLERVVTRATETVLALLPHPEQVKINVRLDPEATISETGVGAAPGPKPDEISIALDDRSAIGLRRSIATWVPASLARILFLKSRTQYGPGYGLTLGDALVSEGLSDHFVTQALPNTPRQPWDHQPITPRQEAGLWKRAKVDLIIPGSYDYEAWFQGTGTLDPLPRWFGYTLAYRIVSPFLTASRTASKAVKTDSEIVYEPYAKTH